MKRTRMSASAIIGQPLPLYVVGLLYDDFDEGGFQVIAICDSIENAKLLVEKAHECFPLVDRKDIVIRPYEINKFYENYV